MRWAGAAFAGLLILVTISSWGGGFGDVLRAWLGLAFLALLLGAWWMFSIEAYRPAIRARDELGNMLHAGDPVSIPEPIEGPDGEAVTGSGWKVQRIVDPKVRVTDDRGRTSDWIGCAALYVKRGKTRLPLDDPALGGEVFSRRRLKGEPDRLNANAPLVIVELRPTEVLISHPEGRRAQVPPARIRRV
jgi:hypothetical protein